MINNDKIQTLKEYIHNYNNSLEKLQEFKQQFVERIKEVCKIVENIRIKYDNMIRNYPIKQIYLSRSNITIWCWFSDFKINDSYVNTEWYDPDYNYPDDKYNSITFPESYLLMPKEQIEALENQDGICKFNSHKESVDLKAKQVELNQEKKDREKFEELKRKFSNDK